MDQWDDVRILLVLLRYGTVRSAAAALSLNHATVSRRIKALEARLGTVLVQRTPDGYRATAAGSVLLSAAESIERELAAATQRVEGSGQQVAGKVRLTMTDLGLELAADALTRVSSKFEALELEVSVTSRYEDLSRRDADLALRLSDSPPGDLVGRRLLRIRGAVYASRAHTKHSGPVPLDKQPWIRWQDPWQRTSHERWVDEHYPSSRCAMRVDSYRAMERAIVAGCGVGILCPTAADRNPALVAVTEPIDELGVDLWLLMHPDLRGVRRVSAVVDALLEDLGASRGRMSTAADRARSTPGRRSPARSRRD
ncbi:MAG: LysR family transcriptional regulator [Myxococcota bacterium]